MSLLHSLSRERVFLEYFDLDDTGRDQGEELRSVVVQFVDSFDVVEQSSRFIKMVNYRFLRTSRRTHEGRTSLTFFSPSFKGEKGGTAPEAFPTETIVPLRLINLKLLSNLHSKNIVNRRKCRHKIRYIRVFTDTIENSIHTFSFGNFQNPLHRIFSRVQNNIISTVSLG